MKTNKISSKQLLIITYFLSNATFLGIGINYILRVSNNDAFIASILGYILGFIFIFMLLHITKYTTKYNIITLNTHLMGKTLGNIINTILVSAFFIMSCIILWILTNYINTQFLSNTPTYIISILFIIPITYCLLKGQETFGRTAQIFFVLSVTLYVISFIGLYNMGHIDNLKPFFKDGANHIFKGSFLFACFSSIPLYALTIIPKNEIDNNKDYNKSILLGYSLSALSIIGVIYIVLSVYSINVAKVFQFPEYSILKEITFFNFIEKIENILTIKWLFDLFALIFMACFFVKQAIKTTFKQNKKTSNITIISIIILITSTPNILFDKFPEVANFIYTNYTYFLIIGIIIPFFITSIFLLTKRKETILLKCTQCQGLIKKERV